MIDDRRYGKDNQYRCELVFDPSEVAWVSRSDSMDDYSMQVKNSTYVHAITAETFYKLKEATDK